MVEAQSSSVARAFWEAVSRPSERGLCRSGAAADQSALLGRERISYGLSLRWRAIIGLSEAAFYTAFAKHLLWNVTMNLHLKVFMVFLLQNKNLNYF